MKKLLSILCIAVVVFTASSCKKETVVAPNNNVTIVKTVRSADWAVYNSTSNTVDLNIPELDE